MRHLPHDTTPDFGANGTRWRCSLLALVPRRGGSWRFTLLVAGAPKILHVRFRFSRIKLRVSADKANVNANVDISVMLKLAFSESCTWKKHKFCSLHVLPQPNLLSVLNLVKHIVLFKETSTFVPEYS